MIAVLDLLAATLVIAVALWGAYKLGTRRPAWRDAHVHTWVDSIYHDEGVPLQVCVRCGDVGNPKDAR